MLRHLHIENYAIIDNLDIDFTPTLNTVTGETGAGKSILLGALGLLSGNRAESAAIATGAKSCVVEAEFKIKGYGLEAMLHEIGIEGKCEEVTIRRVVQSGGKSRAFVEDMPVSLATLRTISETLVDIHSQHKTLLLSRTDFQCEIVDAVAQNSELLQSYQASYGELCAIRAEIKNMRAALNKNQQQRDYLAYQVEQLQEAKVKVGETAELEELQGVLRDANEIIESLSTAEGAINSDEHGALSVLRTARNSVDRVEKYSSTYAELLERLHSAYIELQDIGEELSNCASNIEVNPQRLEVVEERLDLIYTLCKKHNVAHGDELPAVLSHYEEQLQAIEGGEGNILEKEKEAEVILQRTVELAQRLSEKRSGAIPSIEEFMVAELYKLGIAHPRFVVEMTEMELCETGRDSVQFLFSANERTAPQPLQSVASGGEMARVMLCIKNLVAQKIQLPTIIFDEIDTGVSGAVADSFGDIIEEMSASMQVINITHLPQIAAKGRTQFEVYKDSGGTHVRKLQESERVDCIARMLSGAVVTPAAREQAKALLGK